MKKIRHTVITALCLMMFCVFPFAVCAAGQIYTEEDGIKTAYLSSSESITLDDNSTRNTYSTFSSALLALGTEGGRIYICGTVEDTTADGSFSDVIRTSPVLVTGLNGDGTDTLKIGCTMNMGGNFTFEKFTLHITFANGRYMTGGPGTKEFGDGFTTSGALYYRNYNGLDASVTESRTVFNSPTASFIQISGGGYNTDIGSASSSTPALVELVFDNVNFGGDIRYDYNDNGTKVMYANVNIIVNGGSFGSSGQIRPKSSNKITGAVTAILNNGTENKIKTVNEAVDYVIKSGIGGKATIKTQASSGKAPTFKLIPDNQKVPVVNGAVVSKDASGEYLFTPDVSEFQQIFTVTYVEAGEPIVYVIDNERCVFVSTENTVTVNGEEYIPFDNVSTAISALGLNGGKIILTCNISESTFTDIPGRAPVKIVGLTGNEIYSNSLTNPDTLKAVEFNYLGDLFFDNFTFKNTGGGTRVISGSKSASFTTGSNFKTSGSLINLIYTNDHKGTISKDVCVNLGSGSFNNVRMRYTSVPENLGITVIYNGGSGKINLGYEAVFSTQFLGTYNLIINKETSVKNIITENGGQISGDSVYSVIFNNGITGYTFDELAENLTDYKVFSAPGGTVSVYSNGNMQKAPTFLLVPEGNKIPEINGKYIIRTDGLYTYTPALSENQTTINVTWKTGTPEVYKKDGESFAFVKAGGGSVLYNGEVYFAYNDINCAVAALGVTGGTIYVSGVVEFIEGEPYASNNFKDVEARNHLNIIGITDSEPVINYYNNMSISGDLTIDNLAYHRLNGSGTLYDTGFIVNGNNLVLGKNFSSTSDFHAQVLNIHGSEKNITFDNSVIEINNGTITRLAPGSNYSGVTINGNTVVNIKGGSITTILGGNHGGASTDSIYNGNVTYNIDGGSIGSIYTGVNNKTGINGNVTVNITNGTFYNSTLYHGNVKDSTGNYLNGNSIYIITGGKFENASFGDISSRGVIGAEVFIVSQKVSGYQLNISPKGTAIIYNSDKGTVLPVYDENNKILSYKILPLNSELDVLIDGVKAIGVDNVYAIGSGKHKVEFAKKYEVSFNLNGAKGEAPNSFVEYNGTTVTLDIPLAEYKNNTFIGWSDDKNASTGSLEYTVPEKPVTLYAIWKETKTEIVDETAVESSDASEILITTIKEEEYSTHASIDLCENAAENDAAILNGASALYAFSVIAFNDIGENVEEYNSLVDFRIPICILTELCDGEFYRIYKTYNDKVNVVKYTYDENYLYFTDSSVGDYVVMRANSLSAQNVYKGRYDSISGKYVLELYFNGADACYGSFGLKYDTAVLSLDGFTFENGIHNYGIITVEDGGFGSFCNSDGIYQNTWSTDAGIYASGDNPIKIGTFVFSILGTPDNINENTFETASFDESGIVLDNYTLSTVYGEQYYMYAPIIASIDVYPQPIESIFEFSQLAPEYILSVSVALEREYGNSYINIEGIYDGRSIIIVYSESGEKLFTVYENECGIIKDENGKTVINADITLCNGSYTVTFMKNGYVAVSSLVNVSGADAELSFTPVAGDIKNNYEDADGDGVVDIDDFIRILRGFSSDATTQLRYCVDVNEDGVVNIMDIAIVKANFAK